MSKEQNLSVLLSSKSNEHYTPIEIVELAREMLGSIELDPASCLEANKTIKAKFFFSKKEDGLLCSWSAKTIWCNPPYGRIKAKSSQAIWLDKMIEEYKNNKFESGLLLINASTGNKWFKKVWDYPVCLLYRRIQFISDGVIKKQTTHSNAIVYFGKDIEQFKKSFSKIGKIIL